MWTDTLSDRTLSTAALFELLAARRSGLILLEGPTNCGKTTLLRQLTAAFGDHSILLTVEMMRDRIIEYAQRKDPFRMREHYAGAALLCIDDIDMVQGRVFLQGTLARELEALARQMPVILCGIKCTDRVPSLAQLCDTAYAWIPDN